MNIKLKRCEHMGDWYTIIRAKHDGKEWMDQTSPNSYRFMSSERLTPEACIEGNTDEMLEVAKAIKKRGSVSFKRVSVHFENDGVHFCSPKNSERDAIVTVEEANELAAQIFAKLTPNAEVRGCANTKGEPK